MAEPYKVMLIDDDCGVHTLIKRILEDAGYSYCGAYGGEEGLEMLSTEHPDLLLLDVMMPGMNGFDVCKSIREKGRRIPVVFLSAKGDIVDKSIGFKAGGDDYVVKPFSSEELLLRIEAHLRRHKANLAYAKATQREGSNKTGNLEIFFNRYEVYLRGKKVDLTAKEFEILALLASNPVRRSHAVKSTSTFGAATATWTKAASPYSCAKFARRSKTIPRSRNTCSRYGAWDTSSPNEYRHSLEKPERESLPPRRNTALSLEATTPFAPKRHTHQQTARSWAKSGIKLPGDQAALN